MSAHAHGQQHARRHSAGTQHTDPERAATRITQTKTALPKPPAPPPLTCGASRARPRRPPCSYTSSRTVRRKSADAKHRSEVVLEHSHRSGGRKREDRSIAALLVAAQSTALPGTCATPTGQHCCRRLPDEFDECTNISEGSMSMQEATPTGQHCCQRLPDKFIMLSC